MPQALTQSHRSLAINTPLGGDVLLLRHCTINEALSQPFEYQLALGSERTDLRFEDIVGQSVTIRVELPGGGTRYFNGLVSRFAHAGQSGVVAYYQATVVPWLWLLTRTADCRMFQEKSVPEIVKQVFHDRGLTDFREELSSVYRVWEYCVQYRETDFNFVSRLLEQEGITYYFEHANGHHTLVLADSINAHRPYPDYAEIPFRPNSQGVQARDVLVEWRAEERLQSGGYELGDFDFKVPKKLLTAKARQPAAHPWGDLAIFDHPGEYSETAHGLAYAQMRLEELQTERRIFTGRGNARGLSAGCTFALTDFPDDLFNREYLLTQVSCSFQGDALETARNGSGGEFCSVRLTAVEASTPFRPARVTPKPIVQGPQTAVVAGKAGEEIWTDPFGRIKVQFHWDRHGKGDETSSCWIRVAQNWAGRKWGAFFLPRVGQEVVVEFLEGDPDRPIVTGCVYNGESTTPYELPREGTKSTLKSNSSKGGNGFNELCFEDKKGAEQIFLHAERDLDVRVRNDVRETNHGNRDVRVGWVKDGQRGGNMNTLVRADLNTHVEGGQFEQVDQQLNQIVKSDVVEDYQKNQTTRVGETLTLNAQEIVIDGATAIHHQAGKVAIEGAQGVHVRGAIVAIEGSRAVSLKVGGNFITIDASGVSVQGTKVMLNSGGSPIAVESAKSAAVIAVRPPVEARLASSGRSGEATPATAPLAAGSRPLKPRTGPKLAPAVRPEPAAPLLPPPANAEVVAGCAKPKWTARCEHKRTAGRVNGELVLEVVPTRSRKTSVKIGGELELFSATRETGDADRLSLDLTDFHLCTRCGCEPVMQVQLAETSLLRTSGSSLASFPAGNDSFWLGAAVPAIGYIRPEGARCLTEAVTVRVYPSDKYSVQASSEKLVGDLQPIIDRIIDLLRHYSGDVPVVQLPKLAVSGEWSWEEMVGAPQVYYKWQAEISGVLFKLAQPLTPDAPKSALTLKVNLNGVFGPVAFIARYVADFSAFLTLEPKLEIMVRGGSTGPKPEDIQISGGLEGELPLAFGLQLTSHKDLEVVRFESSSAFKTKITGSARAAYRPAGGPGLTDVQIAWEGIEVELEFQIIGAGWFSWAGTDRSSKWPLVEGKTFPEENGFEWFPFQQTTS